MKFTTLYYIGIIAPIFSQACLLPEEREGKPRIVRRQTSNGVAIGTGDRYSAGTIAPRGVGSQTTTFTTLLNVNEIASGIKGLASVYGITTFNTPYKTYNGASITGAKVGGNGTCNDAVRVYLNAAIHARERGASDGLLFFIGDLLYANKNGLGLKYGSKSYTNAQVKTALSTGIVFIPLSNPDGVAYDQSTNSCWRKNRNPKSGTGSSTGVDLNRNFDFVWDLTKWASSVRSEVASSSPSSEVFHGTAAFSEPETQSIKWVMDTYSKVRWFVDLHSYAGDVLYSWGSDTNQASYPGMNFLNTTYNSVRGILSDTPGSGSGYGEYTPTSENTANKAAASKIGSGMSGAAGRSYSVFPASNLYPTSGASDDYSYSRHFADPSKNLIHGYTIEFGFGNSASSCPFYPTQTQHNYNLQEIGAGYMELLLAAVDLGVGDAVGC
ncbi:c3bc2ded-681b-4fa8-8bab-cb1779058bd7 [Sclerotinia trifoliorum]|uniref:C3bc2ded-681b-4fa8-8bab-cb1779058bd7 n=1 Tax=Sclerotinia trifoliorum TaxID=28548 RepID=A0A8H2W498_9HELO|nr:c3bc2ded-681b-4fa8-8bab-cb1779058bd7 [Sclerotinia trifoliorum]